MARKIYDKETKTGWKRIEGQWQYFDNGLVKLPGTDQIKFLKAATGAVYQAGVNTRSGLHNFAEQDKKLRAKQRQSKIQEYKDFGKAVSNFDVKKEFTEEGGRVVKNLGNALSDFTKIGQGSGEFNDKGKELSVFELRRQKEKYQEQEKSKNLSIWNASPESLDIEIEPLELDYSNRIPFDINSDFGKIWGIDTSGFDIETNLKYQNGFKSAQILNALDGANSSVKKTIENAKEEKKKLSVANLKNTNEKVLGGKPDELAIKTELGKNLRKTNFGGTDPGQSLWLGKNSTWTMGGNVVAPKVGTPEAEAMMTPEPTETPIAKEIVSDTPDPVKVDSGLDVQDTSQLVDQSVDIESVVPAAAPAVGANPLPEGFFSGMIDWLNNRGGK